MQDREYHAALQIFQEVLTEMQGAIFTQLSNQEQAVIYCDMADCLAHLNQFEEIITTARKAQEVDNTCARAFVVEAIALTELSKNTEVNEAEQLLDDALEILQQAISMSRD